jgi:septal ring factor EnvC (AmiA/AmiB activator)
MNEAKHTKELVAAIVRSDNAQSRCANGDLLICAIADLERELDTQHGLELEYRKEIGELKRQLSEAQAEIKHLQDVMKLSTATNKERRLKINTLEQQNAELRGYTRHKGGCIANHLPIIKNTADGSDSRACSCGLYKAKANSGAEG